MKITTKLLLFIVVLLSLSFGSLGHLSYYTTKKDIEHHLSARLRHIAGTGSLMISGDAHEEVLKMYLAGEQAKLPQSKAFLKIQESLKKIKKMNHLESDVYTLIHPHWAKDKMLFLVMSADKNYTGNAIEFNELIGETLEKGVVTSTDLYKDSEGIWISGMAPIYTSDGKISGILEVDYEAGTEVQAAIWKSFKDTSMVAIILFTICLACGSLWAKKLVKPIVKLTSISKSVAEGNWNQTFDVSTSDEIGTLSQNFQTMLSEIQKTHKELENYSKTLEERVQSRTKKLSEANAFLHKILNGIEQAVLLFDKEGTIMPIYSEKCGDFFETTMENRKVYEIIAPEKPDVIKSWIELLYTNKKLTFDKLTKLGPKNFPHSLGKSIKLTYLPLMDETNELKYIILVATDETEQIKSREKLIKEQNQSKMILEIQKRKNIFISFLQETKERLDHIEQHFKDHPQFDEKDYHYLLREAHTIKGTSSNFSIMDMAEAAHGFETELGVMIGPPPDSAPLVYKEFEKLKKICLESIAQIEKDYDIGTNTEKTIEIPFSKLLTFSDKIKEKETSKSFFNTFLKEKIHPYIFQYKKSILRLAKGLNKKVEFVFKEGSDEFVYYPSVQNTLGSMVHVYRNSVDHGIELPKERGRHGKPEVATIETKFSTFTKDQNLWYKLTIQDDGKGIDPNIIPEKLKQNGQGIQGLNIDLGDDQQILQAIFLPGFTSREEVTDISGRGMGLNALKEEVENMGGQILIKSEMGVGTQFEILLPEKNFNT